MAPLLFNVYVNDIVQVLECDLLVYADDLKIFNVINSWDDCYMLQNSLDNLYQWCVSNDLQLNIAKCNVVTYYRLQNPIIFNYKVDTEAITMKTCVDDLGITFDSRLEFNSHSMVTWLLSHPECLFLCFELAVALLI